MQPLAMNGDAHSCTGRSEPSQRDLGVCRVCPERAALGWAVPSGAGSSERIQLRCWELAARQLLHGKRTEQTRLGHGAPEATVPCPPPAGTRGAGRWHQRSATAGTSPDGDVGSNAARGLSCYGVGPCGSARRGQEKNGAGGEVAWISGVGEGLPGAALVHPDEDPQRERSAGICGSGGCHSAGIDGAE